MLGTNSPVGAQALTFAIPLGTFASCVSGPSSNVVRTGDRRGRPRRPGWQAPRRAPRIDGGARLGERTGPIAPGTGRCSPCRARGALVPPLSSEARRVEVIEALQFALLAIAVPALVVLGAPWRRLGLAARPTGWPTPKACAVLERPGWPIGWRRSSSSPRAGAEPRLLGPSTWRWWWRGASPSASTPWPASAGCRWSRPSPWWWRGPGLWLELVESPPFAPRLARPEAHRRGRRRHVDDLGDRLPGGAVARVGVPGLCPRGGSRKLSVSADQAITTWVLWFTSLCAFIPVIFANLCRWLRSDEDPDDALHRLVRDGRAEPGGSRAARRPLRTDTVGAPPPRAATLVTLRRGRLGPAATCPRRRSRPWPCHDRRPGVARRSGDSVRAFWFGLIATSAFGRPRSHSGRRGGPHRRGVESLGYLLPRRGSTGSMSDSSKMLRRCTSTRSGRREQARDLGPVGGAQRARFESQVEREGLAHGEDTWSRYRR